MTAQEIAVVGAGPSGLAAAYRLREAGHHVRVLDDRDRPGGKMCTTHRDGFVIDEGPSIMPSGYTHILRLARDAGMGADVLPGGSIFGFAGPDGLHHLDAEHLVRSGLRFDLFGAKAKLGLLRLAADAVASRSRFSFEDLSVAAGWDTETSAEYGRRRAGDEVTHYVVDALIRTLVGASAEELSAVDFRFGFSKFIGARYMVFREGMGSYAHHLASKLDDVRLGCSVTAVEQRARGARVSWTDRTGAEHTEDFDGCVIAADGKTMGRVYGDLDPGRRAFIDKLTYTSHVNVCAALRRAPDEPAFAVNVPASVHPGLIVIVLDHNKLPGHAPPGKGLLSLFTSTGWSRELRDLPDEVVVEQVVGAADRVLPGVAADLEFAGVHRWDPMLMQSYVGYYRGLRDFTELCREKDRHVQLAGDYFCQGSVNAATASGERAARDLHAVLTAPAPVTAA